MNSEIILCKDIKLDRNYNNVLDYTEEQMVALCRQNQIASSNSYSFIRPTNNIYSGFTYSQCLQANYIAFKNPDYSNKWFFAFIDDVIYKSNKNTEIRYTVDAWATWFSYWTKKNCFILRQHVNDDTVGSNTQPEPVDLGKAMVVEGETDKIYNSFSLCALIGSRKDEDVLGTLKNGIYNALGGEYSANLDANYMNQRLSAYKDDYSRIIRVIQYPSVLPDDGTSYTDTISITRKSTIDSYTPVNNKLLTYPFKQIRIISSSGENVVLQYELFSNNSVTLELKGALLPQTFILIYPANYRGMLKDMSKKIALNADIECGWSSGTYVNGVVSQKTADALNLVSNAVLTGIGFAGAVETGGTSLALAGAGIAGAARIGNNINDFAKARNASGSVKGGSSNNVIDVVAGNLGFRVIEECIKAEYAREIDSYFTRYGYAINNIESPNITGRQNWNYIEIGQNESIGYGSVPSGFMEVINNACRKGVTIWHNHTNLGDFSLTNSIVT